jgi:adenylate cyclase
VPLNSRLARLQTAFGRPGRLLACAVLALFCVLRAFDPGGLEEVRLRGFDFEQRLAPRHYEPLPIHIVAIDDESLRRFGQWPWPRTLVASLIRRIAAGQPLALGIDILFSEPDRMSPQRLAEAIPDLPPATARELAAMPSNETRLAEALRTVPTVLGLGASEGATAEKHGPTTMTMVLQSGPDPRPYLQNYPVLIRSLPEITAAERGRGALVGNADRDGVVRRAPLVVWAEGRLVPGFTLEILRVAYHAPIGVVTDDWGVVGARFGNLLLPTDQYARAYPYFTPSLEDRYVSAARLLDGSFDPAALKGSIVLLGVTGLGLVDVKQTPMGPMQGIEVHAQMLESILTKNLLQRRPVMDWIELAVTAVLGLLVIFALPYRNPRVAIGGMLGLAALSLLSGFACFRIAGLLLDGVYPAVSSLASFGVMLGAGLRAAEAARRRLAAELERERELKARLEGELAAARAIQMGLLPRRFPAFPERHDIDLHALIEPARTVGGDLYDFLLLDADRLFFAIADVSGKGIPAALFMAMTKEVLRAAALRHGAALDLVFAEANAKIATASADMLGEGANMMFVTVFAGVLDLSNGRLAYASAGHDSPFALGPALPARQLTAEGGPPIGAVDDFPFTVETAELAPGEMLLLYTDGVTEAENSARDLYGTQRLDQLLVGAERSTAEALIALTREDLRHFVGSADQVDDITMLAVRWLGKAA